MKIKLFFFVLLIITICVLLSVKLKKNDVNISQDEPTPNYQEFNPNDEKMSKKMNNKMNGLTLYEVLDDETYFITKKNYEDKEELKLYKDLKKNENQKIIRTSVDNRTEVKEILEDEYIDDDGNSYTLDYITIYYNSTKFEAVYLEVL